MSKHYCVKIRDGEAYFATKELVVEAGAVCVRDEDLTIYGVMHTFVYQADEDDKRLDGYYKTKADAIAAFEADLFDALKTEVNLAIFKIEQKRQAVRLLAYRDSGS